MNPQNEETQSVQGLGSRGQNKTNVPIISGPVAEDNSEFWFYLGVWSLAAMEIGALLGQLSNVLWGLPK